MATIERLSSDGHPDGDQQRVRMEDLRDLKYLVKRTISEMEKDE